MLTLSAFGITFGMKTLALLPASVLFLASCKKEEAPPAPTIVGTWKYTTEITMAAPLSGGASTTASRSLKASTTLLTFEALGLGTAYYSYGGQPSAKVHYSYLGDDLTINDPSYPQAYKVLSLTRNSLVLKSNSSDGKFSYVVTDSLSRIP